MAASQRGNQHRPARSEGPPAAGQPAPHSCPPPARALRHKNEVGRRKAPWHWPDRSRGHPRLPMRSLLSSIPRRTGQCYPTPGSSCPAQPALASVLAEAFFHSSPPPFLTLRRRRTARFGCGAAREEVTMAEPRDSNSRKRVWAGASAAGWGPPFPRLRQGAVLVGAER